MAQMSDNIKADILRERYDNIVSVIDGNNLTGEDEHIIDDAFLDTAYDYTLAAAEAQAWHERFERLQNAFKLKEVTLTTDELYERAKKFWPAEWAQR